MDDLLELSFLLEKVTREEIGHHSFPFQFLLKFHPDGVRTIDSSQTSPATSANSLNGIFQDGIAGETNRRVDEIPQRNEDILEESIHPLPKVVLSYAQRRHDHDSLPFYTVIFRTSPSQSLLSGRLLPDCYFPDLCGRIVTSRTSPAGLLLPGPLRPNRYFPDFSRRIVTLRPLYPDRCFSTSAARL